MKHMPATGSSSVDHVAWATRVNARWIVHHDLNRSAGAYLAHLAQADPPRLALSCRNAHLMVELGGATEDPKPWFYAGLFSLATADEAGKYLAAHWLTKIVTDASGNASAAPPEKVSETTLVKIQCIQVALAGLPGGPS